MIPCCQGTTKNYQNQKFGMPGTPFITVVFIGLSYGHKEKDSWFFPLLGHLKRKKEPKIEIPVSS